MSSYSNTTQKKPNQREMNDQTKKGFPFHFDERKKIVATKFLEFNPKQQKVTNREQTCQ